MIEKVNNQSLRPQRNYSRRGVNNQMPPVSFSKRRQPFWLPAVSFYILATAFALMAFFLAWGFLHDAHEGDMPWIPAGIIAGAVLSGSVILREIILRKRRYTLLLAQERLDQNLKNIHRQKQTAPDDENKLTLEKNAAILKQIAAKSEAANVFGKLPEAHWDVFELCDSYLQRNAKELETVRGGSPRIAALRQGREKVLELHKYHLLAWSSAESRSLIQEAKASATISKRHDVAAKALSVLETAKEFYPNEQQLIDSLEAVREFITTVKVSHWVEQAERSAFKGNYKRALNHYRDALFYLARENVRSEERDLIAEKINLEIAKLTKLSGDNQNKQTPEERRNIAEHND